MEKNKNKNKIREPFPPENTPVPPQVMDTSQQPESGTKENDQAKAEQEKKDQQKGKKTVDDKPEIDDETTI